ncbi:MAG: hypothetical protein NTW21_21190 [Verrucomicrobia bacterium]|nr:hypothetical protein [Verrucomicrobiota bacterium]
MTDPIDRPQMEADILCVGCGPASGGFLTTLAAAPCHPDGTPALASPAMPGMPLQVRPAASGRSRVWFMVVGFPADF